MPSPKRKRTQADIDGRKRLYGAETHAEPNHVAAIVGALQRLALRHEADSLADACEASAHAWGL